MGDDGRTEVTRLLHGADRGNPADRDRLLELVYDELRSLARAQLAREAPGQTLQATALVHEAFLRLVGPVDSGWNGRAHFFGAAARAMRRILVEQARRKARLRHGGGRERVDVDHFELESPVPGEQILALEEAVRRLEEQDPRKAQVVHLHHYLGLTTEETARVLGVSSSTVEREWRFLKAWLRAELDGTS